MHNYCRINLARTNYTQWPNWTWLKYPDTEELLEIFSAYCRYKQFGSVQPIYSEQFTQTDVDIIGYRDQGQLVAWSMLRRLNSRAVEAVQFAWDYSRPAAQLGIASLQNECNVYKGLGYEYLYLGLVDHYKTRLQGYEQLGPL
jgi:hypothetical protein